MSDDPFDSPDWQRVANHAREKLEPMVRKSAASMMFISGAVDPKLAIEMGYSILLDKPIIALVVPGAPVSDKVIRVADRIVEADINDVQGTRDRIAAALKELDL